MMMVVPIVVGLMVAVLVVVVVVVAKQVRVKPVQAAIFRELPVQSTCVTPSAIPVWEPAYPVAHVQSLELVAPSLEHTAFAPQPVTPQSATSKKKYIQ